jgi:hypothetical protein
VLTTALPKRSRHLGSAFHSGAMTVRCQTAITVRTPGQLLRHTVEIITGPVRFRTPLLALRGGSSLLTRCPVPNFNNPRIPRIYAPLSAYSAVRLVAQFRFHLRRLALTDLPGFRSLPDSLRLGSLSDHRSRSVTRRQARCSLQPPGTLIIMQRNPGNVKGKTRRIVLLSSENIRQYDQQLTTRQTRISGG